MDRDGRPGIATTSRSARSAGETRPDTGSGRVRSFWVEALFQAEQMRCGNEGDMVVESVIGPAFVVAQTQGLLHLAVIGLDAPATGRVLDEDGQRSVCGQVGDPSTKRFNVVLASPLDQQRALGQKALPG